MLFNCPKIGEFAWLLNSENTLRIFFVFRCIPILVNISGAPENCNKHNPGGILVSFYFLAYYFTYNTILMIDCYAQNFFRFTFDLYVFQVKSIPLDLNINLQTSIFFESAFFPRQPNFSVFLEAWCEKPSFFKKKFALEDFSFSFLLFKK